MPPSAYDDIDKLQDIVLETLSNADTEFYLRGGTAASRGYLHHRFSDDLDFLVNDDKRFALWADKFRQALLSLPHSQLSVQLNEATSKDEAQLPHYLKATGVRVGVLINVGSHGKLEWKRMVL